MTTPSPNQLDNCVNEKCLRGYNHDGPHKGWQWCTDGNGKGRVFDFDDDGRDLSGD